MLILLSSLGAWATEWRAATGAELNADPHGVIDLGARSGPWSAQLLTDTLDVRYAPEHDRGRWWVGLRGELMIAELMAFPWRDGAPTPELGIYASYAGLEGGWIRYLPAGLYVGVQGYARQYRFSPVVETTPAPPNTHRVRAEALAGWWTEAVQLYGVAGCQQTRDGVAPHGQVTMQARPDWTMAPMVGAWAGWAQGQRALTRTRMGGLNPYVVPLAGAGWAEWWVEDFVVLRAGPSIDFGTVRLGLAADVGWSDVSDLVWGVGAHSRVQGARPLFFQLDAGYGAGVPRSEGVWPLSVWWLVGRDWGERGQSSG